MKCNLCPRSCNVDRTKEAGYCGESENIRISRAALHMWEEPCISGETGSGAVFFTGCQLKCVFCQNYDIAHNKKGRTITTSELSEIFLELESQGANNINLVTADHFIPSVAKAIEKAKIKGIKIPFVYNSGGYIKKTSLKILDGLIDVYLPDFKYYSSFVARKYSNAPDYPETVKAAIEEMILQRGEPIFNEKGILINGVLVRHLVLPGNVPDSKKVIDYLYKTYGNRILLSIMNQYTPVNHNVRFPELKRQLSQEEYDEVLSFAYELGIINAFCQEEGTQSAEFIPEFYD